MSTSVKNHRKIISLRGFLSTDPVDLTNEAPTLGPWAILGPLRPAADATPATGRVAATRSATRCDKLCRVAAIGSIGNPMEFQ